MTSRRCRTRAVLLGNGPETDAAMFVAKPQEYQISSLALPLKSRTPGKRTTDANLLAAVVIIELRRDSQRLTP